MSRVSDDSLLPRQVASMVRGPASLQDDIADEIADHLACRADGEPQNDPAAAHSAAVQAFGDPERIARELRAVHLGDLIMFQRITIAALVVIVAGMAATAYFSWSAARGTTEQFAEMNERLASLVELQRSAQPAGEEPPPMARLKIFCGLSPSDEPADGQRVWVRTPPPDRRPAPPGEPFVKTYLADAAGWITTEPLKRAEYELSGVLWSIDDRTRTNVGQWRREVALRDEDGDVKELRLTVGSRCVHDLRIDVPAELS